MPGSASRPTVAAIALRRSHRGNDVSDSDAERSAHTPLQAMRRVLSVPTIETKDLAGRVQRASRQLGNGMGQTARFQDVLRRLAIIDDSLVETQAGLALGLAEALVLNPKTAALVQVGALVAIGSPAVCLEWSTTRALAVGATEDEITDVLLAVAPIAGIGRAVGAVTDVAAALGYDIEAALDNPASH